MMQRHGYRPLSGVVGVSAKPHASANIERDHPVGGYVPNAGAVRAIGLFSAGLGSGAAMSVVGPYGSGKSTFGVVLNGLAAPYKDASWNAAYGMLLKTAPDTAKKIEDGRQRAGVHELGMIRCIATARQEPVGATILRAAASGAESYFGVSYRRSDFAEAGTLHRCAKSLQRGVIPDAATISKIIASMADTAPVLLLVDEFGKNIEYFADGGSDGDLFILQELAEMSGGSRGVHLHVVTMQHMSFGEYVAGAPAARTREWAKIQGRFEVVHFSNSLEHTRALLVGSLKRRSEKRRIREWAEQHAKAASARAGMSVPVDLAASCYPLHPLAVEALPELCSRYGQNDRTLLSFVFGGGPGTVARFVEQSRWDGRGALPTMCTDSLYDYFVAGSAPTRTGAAHSSRLVEIDTIIRDSRLGDETERRVLKTVGVLNLVGRSGRLRASMGTIRCMVGEGAERAVRSLESRSIITYRRHADEYRVWHGTDIDIAAKLDAFRKAALDMPHPKLMNDAIEPDPVVAAKHGMETGTVRIFDGSFELEVANMHDGAMVYGTVNTDIPESDRPVLVARRDVSKLVGAAAEVVALRSVLGDEDVAGDWVARGEVAERLAAAESALEIEFDQTYGAGTDWMCRMGGKMHKFSGTAGAVASDASHMAYPDTPMIRNEMINRNRLTPQGSAALNRLMQAMITREGEPLLGIVGWGPERAVYEAVIREHGMHGRVGGFSGPHLGPLRRAWSAALTKMRGTHRQVQLTDIYDMWRMPPYGMKSGVMPILALLMMLVKRSRVAVYEHGSYVPRIIPSMAERMVKNPQHFSLKYHHMARSRADLIERAAASLQIGPDAGMLGVVGHLVGVVRALPAYTKKTKNLTENALAVRNAVQNAVEPDTLLFESLPKALGVGSPARSVELGDNLGRAVNELRGAFDSMMSGMVGRLLDETDMPDRQSLAEAASKLLPDTSDQRMRVFLGAVSADIPDEKAWISYVGLTLTDVPPADWNDGHAEMFGNGLREVSAGFRRLAALRFAAVSGSFGGPSVMVTITRPDGSEESMVLPADDGRVAGLAS